MSTSIAVGPTRPGSPPVPRDQEYFDQSFRLNPNHWEYDRVPFRIRKHLQTWRLLRGRRYGRVCEIGCAAGVFTRYLRRIADRVDAFDISPVVIDHNERHNTDPGIRYARLDLARQYAQVPCAEYDLIVVMEVLSYLARDTVRAILDHLTARLCGTGTQLLLSTRLSNGDMRMYGEHEYSGPEFLGLLESRFRIVDAAAVQLREELAGMPTPPDGNTEPWVRPVLEWLGRVYRQRHLQECGETLAMGAWIDDVELAAWLLEARDVPA